MDVDTPFRRRMDSVRIQVGPNTEVRLARPLLTLEDWGSILETAGPRDRICWHDECCCLIMGQCSSKQSRVARERLFEPAIKMVVALVIQLVQRTLTSAARMLPTPRAAHIIAGPSGLRELLKRSAYRAFLTMSHRNQHPLQQ